MENDVLLKVQNLVVHYETHNAVVEAVNNVSFEIRSGQTLGLVGETGAGKTTIALAIMSLLPKYTGKVIQGSIEFDGRDLRQLSPKEMRSIRGHDISMIFQDPMSSLNPVLPVDEQISELIRLHRRCSRAKAAIEAREILKKVGIQPERAGEYPHQFSGGMKQRIVIAMALVAEPELLLADEPTTALDVTIQAQILELMKQLKEKFNSAMILITHDLGVVAEFCDNVAIVYAGEVIEYGSVEEIYARRKNHPYTAGLFNCIPDLYTTTPRLDPIPGFMADPTDLPEGCKFAPRCPHCMDCCASEAPEMYYMGGHGIKCHLFREEGTHNADTTD